MPAMTTARASEFSGEEMKTIPLEGTVSHSDTREEK